MPRSCTKPSTTRPMPSATTRPFDSVRRRPADASSDATSPSGGSKRGLRQRVVGSGCPYDPNGGVSQADNPADAWAYLGAESRQRILPRGPMAPPRPCLFTPCGRPAADSDRRLRLAIAPAPAQVDEWLPVGGVARSRADRTEASRARRTWVDLFAPSPPTRTHPRRDPSGRYVRRASLSMKCHHRRRIDISERRPTVARAFMSLDRPTDSRTVSSTIESMPPTR